LREFIYCSFFFENQRKQNYSEVGCPRCQELEIALLRASPISTADYISKNTIKFIISRSHYKEIKSAMRKSNKFFVLIVDDKTQSLVHVEPDT
jgi:phage FluMu protein Com